jgi:SAM-dependent methyltransferase
LRAWAEAYPQHEVIGIDLAPSAVLSARENCAELGNVEIIEADFFALPQWYRNQKIGLIWEHTCFCAIPPSLRDAYVATVSQLLSSGGHLIGAFFTDMDDGDQGPPWNTPMEEMMLRFSPHFTIENFEGEHRTFGGRESEERSIVMRRL